MFDQDKSKYAYIKMYGNYGYGHIDTTIYHMTDRMWSAPTLNVTSQLGMAGRDPEPNCEIYAWRFGALPYCSDLLCLSDMEDVIKPLRTINKRIEKLADKLGTPRTFQEFLFRVLISSNLDYVIANPNYGGGYSCKLEDLPRIDMRSAWAVDELRRSLDEMVAQMIAKFYPVKKEQAA